MKEPQHPVGPAFDHSLDREEAWRQQQISALTQEQRRSYQQHEQNEQERLATERQNIEAQKPKRIETEKQQLLTGKPAPELRMAQNEAMKQKKAGELAQAAIEQKSKTEFERAEKEMRGRLDGHLRHAEQARAESQRQDQKTNRDFNEQAKTQEKNRTSDRRDDALARAFEKAQRQQEQQRQQERAQQAHEQAKSRTKER